MLNEERADDRMRAGNEAGEISYPRTGVLGMWRAVPCNVREGRTGFLCGRRREEPDRICIDHLR